MHPRQAWCKLENAKIVSGPQPAIKLNQISELRQYVQLHRSFNVPPEYLNTNDVLHMQLCNIYQQMAFQIQKYQNAHLQVIFLVR